MFPRPLPALLGLLLTALAPSAARAYDAWVLDVSGCPDEVRFRHVQAEFYGTLPTTAGSGEVKVETHVLEDGQTVPLPVYDSDGTSAGEEEVFWTVSLEDAVCLTHPPASLIELRFTGRTLDAEWSSCHNPGPTELRFRITVVAVRGADPVGLDDGSFGRVKAEFR